jgi:hypothetical protein
MEVWIRQVSFLDLYLEFDDSGQLSTKIYDIVYYRLRRDGIYFDKILVSEYKLFKRSDKANLFISRGFADFLLRSCQSFGLTDMKILSDRKIFCRSEKKAPKNSLPHA